MMSPLRRCLFLLLLTPWPVVAQTWLPGDAVPQVVRASLRRQARDADTALTNWRATADGQVRTVIVVDQGQGPRERLMKLDSLTVEVYGEIPTRSKQVITQWREISFLPNRIVYHRDHLGIVANDFGQTIRLGEGDEVRDIIHPLTPQGATHYRFAPGDTVRIRTHRGETQVVAIAVRPADPEAPGTVGTLYVDQTRDELIRFEFTFTPASYIDRTVRDITVSLESALLESTHWLPWRQSIVIRREDPRFELPTRTVLRADWELRDYRFSERQPPEFFAGRLIAGPLRAPRDTVGALPLLPEAAVLPSVERDVEQIQAAASAMLAGRALDGLNAVRTALAGYHDLLHVNRVSGVTPGYGLRFPLRHRITARVHGAYGLSDHRGYFRLGIDGPLGEGGWGVGVSRQLRDVADQSGTSPMHASVAALAGDGESADWVLLERAAIRWRGPAGGTRLTVELARERPISVVTAFAPSRLRSNPALGAAPQTVLRFDLDHLAPNGLGWQGRLEAGQGTDPWLRAAAHWQGRVGRWEGRIDGGIGTDRLPAYRSFVLGGIGSLPGVPHRAIGGRRSLRAEVGYGLPVAIPLPIPRGLPYGGMARRVTLPSRLVPFLAAGVAGGDLPSVPWRGRGSIEPVAGLRLDLWGDLLRVEGGVALRHGRAAFLIDIHPDWWPIF